MSEAATETENEQNDNTQQIMRKTKRKGDTKRDTTRHRNMTSKDGAEGQKYTTMHSAT